MSHILPKTPVSILQEMMVKKGTTPNYELIHNGGGTHENIFTYQVSCDGLVETGTGRCKKDAKHEAAKAMLEAIAKHNSLPQLPASPLDSPIRTPQPVIVPVPPKSPAHVPFRNTIGELQDLCSANHLEDPEYKEISDVGPPHARVFTIHCLVSTFVEKGIATTKKQAKHQAAQKMIDRITAVVSDDDFVRDEIKKQEQIASKIAMARYPELSVNNEAMKSKVNWGLKVQNFYKRFKESLDEDKCKNLQQKLELLCNLVRNCKNDCNEESISNLKLELESTLTFVDVKVYYTSFASKSPRVKYITGMQLSTAPDIFEIGLGNSESEAELNATEKIIDSLQFFIS